MNRLELLLTLASSSDEVFSWFVAWANSGDIQSSSSFKYPKGLGDFTPDSRQQIKVLQLAASRYIDSFAKGGIANE